MGVEEDPRRTALKNGLRQCADYELRRLIAHVEANKPVLLDRDEHGAANYSNDIYCPLGVAIGLAEDGFIVPVTDDDVSRYLRGLGFKIYNTRGVAGAFYTTNRRDDLLVAAREVLEEKETVFA